MRERYSFLNGLGVLAVGGTFTYHVLNGENVRTSLEAAMKCTTVLIGAEFSMYLVDRLLKSPQLNAYVYFLSVGVALRIAEWLDDLEREITGKPKILQQKTELAEYNHKLQQNLVTMLVEAGEPVQEEGYNGEVRHGYRVIAGLPEPQTFFPSKDVRARVEALKKSWVAKSLPLKSGEAALFM